MYCVFIHGPAASGKLTVANGLKARSGLPVFHNHLAVDAALSLFEFGSPGFVRLREAVWLAAFREAAERGRSFIFTFSPEASVPPAFIDTAVDVIEGAGGQVLFVSLTCGEAVIEERIEAASRSAFRKLTSLAEYRQLRERGAFAFPPLPADITIATDELSPEDAAGLIQELIGNRGIH
ncbi:MAG TPA: shikimate kinase [Thermoanaerobaculia bacterium]|nr:shikimate kinase [Thermoanaerobaculia bacterium]